MGGRLAGLRGIREEHGVPAFLGRRVSYTFAGVTRLGIVMGGRGGKLLVQFDGTQREVPVHPVDRVTYPGTRA